MSRTVVSGDICAHECQGFGPCRLSPNHKGRHSTEVFICDACGRRRRGKPARSEPDYEGGVFHTCFMCVEDARQWEAKQ